MKTFLAWSSALLILFLCSCARSPDSGEQAESPTTLVTEGYDEQEMQAAIARAKKEVDAFIAEFTEGDGSDFSVKAPIEDQGDTEHFWLTHITYRDGLFEGVIGNDPGIVSNVRIGQKWTIKKEDISDWMYMRDGKIHGNYTMRPLLKTMPEQQAAQLRSMLAEP
ncbi:MAG: DUF2314 domain-containing protein [Pirellulaceae bacterium]